MTLTVAVNKKSNKALFKTVKQGKAIIMAKEMAETDKRYCFFEALDACLNALYVIIGTNGTSLTFDFTALHLQ